ncbi:MAG: S1C family serine protease [Ilumatobacteraceae bacterium]
MNLQHRALHVLAGGLLGVSCGATASPTTHIADSAVQIVANGCHSAEVHGAGLMVAAGKVATVAHVVAGATSVEVRSARGTSAATVVYFDPILDVAVLSVDAALATPIGIGSATAGDRGNVIVYRDDAPVNLPAEVQRLVDIRTADIYGEGKHIRPGYELKLDIRAGDSGAVVVIGGKAVALVWATSRRAESRAWAMRASLIADHLSTNAPVDNGECP